MDSTNLSNASKMVATAETIVLISLCVFIALRFINRKIEDITKRHTARKSVLYGATALGLLVLVLTWIEQLKNLPVILSVTAAGLVVALGDAIVCIAGWFYIVVRRPYSIGDRVQIGTVIGDVIDIKLFDTTLLEVGGWVSGEQSTFRLVHCPNNALFRQPIWNYTSGFPFVWDELTVTVAFESDWRKARQIMLDRAAQATQETQARVESDIKQLTKKYPVKYSTFTPAVYVKIGDSGVTLTVRFLTDARRRRTIEDELSRQMLQDFAEHPDINFAYPTYRIVGETGAPRDIQTH
jgi:small-conductance mechanosensitive channel